MNTLNQHGRAVPNEGARFRLLRDGRDYHNFPDGPDSAANPLWREK